VGRKLTIAVALACEARPIIKHYGLKRNYSIHPFEVYQDERIDLIITGIGKVKMAAAVSYLRNEGGYLNVGIAGSDTFGLGEFIVANKIIDAATQRAFYPFFGVNKVHCRAAVISYDKPQMSYPKDSIVDMEASAFFETASLFVPQELVQSVKIVSDTKPEEMKCLNAAFIETLIEAHFSRINEWVNVLSVQLPYQV
jgi:adenosylhomocysteine nucleosidase